MKVSEIREESSLELLRVVWGELLRSSASNNIFLTWEWLAAWWSAYGVTGELRILTVYDDAGVLRGIAPLRSRVVRRYGQTLESLQFIGDAPSDSDSDYLDFIIARGYEQEVIEALHEYWTEGCRHGAVLLLNEIPEGSPNLVALSALAQSRGMCLTATDVACGTVRLPDKWDDYIAMLRPRFRTKVRSVLRNLEKRPAVRFRFCEEAAEYERMLPILFDLHARRWQQDGKTGVFGDLNKQAFYRTITPALFEGGWLRFSYLEWNNHVLACQYGFVYDGTYYQLQEGYEPASEHWNVGVGLRAWSIRELMKQGVREYDFLGGVGRHKTEWGAEVKQSKRMLLAHCNLSNALFIHGPEWESWTRKRIRTILPQKAVGAANSEHEEVEASGSGRPAWVRQVAAACYVHSGAPALVRTLRDRYQLSLAPNRTVPKPSWRKRVEGSARIFYYHRVNDENDPFCPAISTALFEAHMQYLARHYRVVNMADLRRHLQSGDPEMVVGVTFDDGYRDNYECAFPILRRYNIPATIFLTTGTLDSGEPLWFEELAEATRKTNQDFIDLEVDIPRRFWMRTQLERLESTKTLFELLRSLSDVERHNCLGEILRYLGSGKECHRKSTMLSWEQVRFMSANGIEFGGHTVTHPFMSKLTAQQALWEVSECKRRIDEEVQVPTSVFAYPNGREEDFAASNKELLRTAGYQAAVTTIWGMNHQSTDPMELRRGGPWENDPAVFALKLDWYQLTNQ